MTNTVNPTQALGPNRPRRPRGCLLFPGTLLVMAGTAYVARESILPALARWWIVDERPDSADAILILGGNASVRCAGAARIFEAGSAPRILITSPELTEVQKMGILPTDAQTTRILLLRLGIAPEAIEIIPVTATSTRDEAIALKQWCADNHASRIIIPTDLFHSRRVNWIIERTLADTGTDIRVVALNQPTYTAANWWKFEEGLLAFQNEVIKLLYYKVNY